MKLTKNRLRSQLTEEHLKSQFGIATTSVKADINKLARARNFKGPTKILI